LLTTPRPPPTTLFPYTTLFRSSLHARDDQAQLVRQLSEYVEIHVLEREGGGVDISVGNGRPAIVGETAYEIEVASAPPAGYATLDRKSTRLNSSHVKISYAVFC